METYLIRHIDKGGDMTATKTTTGGIVVTDERGSVTRKITPAYVRKAGGVHDALTALYRRTKSDRFWWSSIDRVM